MNFIQTLSFSKFKDPYQDTFGWAAPVYHLMGWALSSLQIQKFYGKVDLYCNNEAANLLINELGLPYSQVYISHNELVMPDVKLWALPKIFTYSLQTKPFIHIDGDVFLFDKLPSSLLEGDLISQNIEEASNYYLQTQKELMEIFSYFPKCVEADFKSDLKIKAVNAGILGGKDINFFREYTELAFKYIDKNSQHLNTINVDRFNIFFEQHLFYSLAKEKEIDIKFLINSIIKDNQYRDLGNFHETPCKRSYLHLLGQYKKDEYTCRLMASKLRELHPDYYFKIISIFSENIKNNFHIPYNVQNLNSFGSYQLFSKNSLAVFHSTRSSGGIKILEPSKSKPQVLSLLQTLIDDIESNDFFTKKQLEDDFQDFSKNLLEILNKDLKYSKEYIYGRDLSSVNWYCKIFSKESEPMEKSIRKCDEINIIRSKFDWSGLFNKHTRIAVEYYEHLKLHPGEFFTLVTPEIYGDGFSIHDIDEMEYIILSHLLSPTSVADLFAHMLEYVEDEIIQNYINDYKILFFEMLTQLIIKKAIMPEINTN